MSNPSTVPVEEKPFDFLGENFSAVLVGIFVIALMGAGWSGLIWNSANAYLRGSVVEVEAVRSEERLTEVPVDRGTANIPVNGMVITLNGEEEWIANLSKKPGEKFFVLYHPAGNYVRALSIQSADEFFFPSFGQILAMAILCAGGLMILIFQARGFAYVWKSSSDDLEQRIAAIKSSGAPDRIQTLNRFVVFVRVTTSWILILAISLLWLLVCGSLLLIALQNRSESNILGGFKVMILFGLSLASLPMIAHWIDRNHEQHPILTPLASVFKDLVFCVLVGSALWRLLVGFLNHDASLTEISFAKSALDLFKVILGF